MAWPAAAIHHIGRVGFAGGSWAFGGRQSGLWNRHQGGGEPIWCSPLTGQESSRHFQLPSPDFFPCLGATSFEGVSLEEGGFQPTLQLPIAGLFGLGRLLLLRVGAAFWGLGAASGSPDF